MANNLKALRVQFGLSQEDLAERMGTSRNQLTKLESGARRLSDVWIAKAAKALSIDPGELVSERVQNAVPIMGYIGAGAVIEPDFEQVPPEGLDSVELPFQVPPDIIGLQVRGDSMLPTHEDGDILCVWKDQRYPVDVYVGEQVAVRTSDGRRYFKRLLRGDRKLFNLESSNARTIEGVLIEWIGEIYVTVKLGQIQRIRSRAKTRSRRQTSTHVDRADRDMFPDV